MADRVAELSRAGAASQTNPLTPVLHGPQKRKKNSRFLEQIDDWKHTYLRFFLRTMFRNSAVTPASPLIRKSTTLRSSLWCSHYSVAKATAVFVSSRHRDFVAEGDFVAEVGKCGSRSLDLLFLVLWPSVFFTAPPSMSSTRTYEYFSKNLVRCNVFF